jgi:cationic peptide transport system permease protein
MIIFTLRRLLLLLVTLFLLTLSAFSLSYFTPHAPLQGSSLWDAWLFWFNGCCTGISACPASTGSLSPNS